MLLEVLALSLGLIHFATPLVYYTYLKKFSQRPWNIRVDRALRYRVTVILPTYNEASLIKDRLENIKQQDYPKKLLKIIVVDSSNDRTAEIVEEWSQANTALNLIIIKERTRKGKLHAIQQALKRVSSDCDVVVFTDADVSWDPDALSKAAGYLTDPDIGVVTASITYTGAKEDISGNTYRKYYNIVRVAESRIHSTPIHNGPFLAIKAELLKRVGLPMFEGSDDSAFGSFIAFTGKRAIEVNDIAVKEPLRGSDSLRQIRRAQHLLLNFLVTKRHAKEKRLYTKSTFDKIWIVEWWLHVVNPWLLVIGTGFLFFSLATYGSLMGLAFLAIGSIPLISKMFRMWVSQQLFLIIGAVRNLWTRDAVWKK